jgi:hypothetical protein
MNEQQWLTSSGPKWMLEHVRDRASPRKLRLFACASLRRLDSPDEPAFRHAVETAEAFAEGRATNADAVAASRAAFASLSQQGDQPGEDHAAIRTALEYLVGNIPWDAAHAYMWVVSRRQRVPAERQAELAAQCELLRCLFGNPFRPVALQPAWLAHNDGAVAHLARVIDEERSFEDLPCLADALEEAGCEDASLLLHCRQRQQHARGCWVVDLLLGRE